MPAQAVMPVKGHFFPSQESAANAIRNTKKRLSTITKGRVQIAQLARVRTMPAQAVLPVKVHFFPSLESATNARQSSKTKSWTNFAERARNVSLVSSQTKRAPNVLCALGQDPTQMEHLDSAKIAQQSSKTRSWMTTV
jgi:hypothetical protein